MKRHAARLIERRARKVWRSRCVVERIDAVKLRNAAVVAHCPSCGTRIVPTPKEMRRWRLDAGLTQREMARRLKISAAFVAYLEGGKRSPSATVIARYWKFIPR
jgi:DNA-binding XRE family transcriptional regulator